MKHKIEIRVTGAKGQTDGYVETILGIFAMTGVLVKPAKLSKRYPDANTVQIYMDVELIKPPLGNLGEADLRLRDEGEPN